MQLKKENQIKKREEDIIEDRKREPKRRLKHLLLDPLAISYKVVQEKRVFDKDKIWGEVIPYSREEELLNTYKSQYDY